MNVVDLLLKMGFSKSCISETILSITCSEAAHSAPIGFTLRNGKLRAKIYRGTKIHEMISKGSSCELCMCITNNSLLFYRALLRRESLEYECIEELGVKCISNCSAYVSLVIDSIVNRREYSVVYFEPTSVAISSKHPRAHRRADHALIEALVYLTKLPFVENRGELFSRILWCREVVYRSSRSKAYRAAINDVVERSRELLN